MIYKLLPLCFLLCFACSSDNTIPKSTKLTYPDSTFLIVLGTAQDAGYPQADCKKDCCKDVWKNESLRKMVSCIGLVEPQQQKAWLLDATPDFKDQLQWLQTANNHNTNQLGGIFITHAHIGHYTGLMHLGREAMGAKSVPVYAMPRFGDYLKNNGPWSQLVSLQNIDIQALSNDTPVSVGSNLQVTPILVPHREEFSETVGFRIKGSKKSALFIPDIDKWQLWERDIIKEIAAVDYAFLDGTFFKNGEIPGRDMSQIPHPFVEESIKIFSELPANEKSKIHFIHFNHTNPILKENSPAQQTVRNAGLNIAMEGQVFGL